MFKKADIPLTNVVPSGAQRVQAVLLSPSMKPLGSPCTPCPMTTSKKHTNIVPAEIIPRIVVWRRSRMRLPAHMTALEEEEGVVRSVVSWSGQDVRKLTGGRLPKRSCRWYNREC